MRKQGTTAQAARTGDQLPNAVLHVKCIFGEFLHKVAHHLLAAMPGCMVQACESLNVSLQEIATRFDELFHLRERCILDQQQCIQAATTYIRSKSLQWDQWKTISVCSSTTSSSSEQSPHMNHLLQYHLSTEVSSSPLPHFLSWQRRRVGG